jgi:hypothetical protein
MCVENITIALCAPHNPPHLSFTCGKLHMVAQNRVVCNKARGSCICYFGTCGNVVRDAPTNGIDFSGVAKVRCVSCTAREDVVGDSRENQEVLESVLLDRPAINDAAWSQQSKLLQKRWSHKSACPYHSEGSATKDMAIVDEPAKEHVWVQVDTKPVADSAPAAASFVEVAIDKPAPVEPAATDRSEHTEADSGPAIDPWTGNPIKTKTVTTGPASFGSPSGKDDVTTVIPDNNDGGASAQASDSDKGTTFIQHIT